MSRDCEAEVKEKARRNWKPTGRFASELRGAIRPSAMVGTLAGDRIQLGGSELKPRTKAWQSGECNGRITQTLEFVNFTETLPKYPKLTIDFSLSRRYT